MDETVKGFSWQLPGSAFAVLVFARITTAVTWGWAAFGVAPWNGYGWLRQAIVISQEHTWVPGWSGVAGFLLANLGWVAPLFFAWNLYLFVTLLLGFMTRFHGLLAAIWEGIIVVLAVSIPKSAAPLEEFPVPIGGWLWLLGPIVVFPLVAAARAGRLWGLDGALRQRWTEAGGTKARLARWM